jgi:hypothetical protein
MNSMRAARIEAAFKGLIGLSLVKSWNIYATRLFYFGPPGLHGGDGEYRISLECPWRIERHADKQILVGSEDHGIRADGNSDPSWKPAEMQWGIARMKSSLRFSAKHERDRSTLPSRNQWWRP